jgi:hypothetical protein
MTIKPQTTFKERLSEALSVIGYFDRDEQIVKIAEFAGVTKKTASHYFTLDRCPMNKYPLRLISLASSLECDSVWLYNGSGQSPLEKYLFKKVSELAKREKDAFAKGLLCLSNKDPVGCHTVEQFLNGSISKNQFLELI